MKTSVATYSFSLTLPPSESSVRGSVYYSLSLHPPEQVKGLLSGGP